MKNNKKIIKVVIIILLLISFFTIWNSVKVGTINTFDQKIYESVTSIKSESLTNIVIIITDSGGVIGLTTIAIVTAIVLVKRNRKKEAIAVLLNLLLSTIIYYVFKQIFQRPRPITGDIIINEGGYSFPSGHTTNNIAFYFFAIYLISLNVKNKKIMNLLIMIFTIIPLLIGITRIYLRVHYPSDVLAGIVLGVIIVLTSIEIYKNL